MNDRADSPPTSGGDAYVHVHATDTVITMPPESTVLAVADELTGDQVGIVIVGSPGEVQSVISERDVVRDVADGCDPAVTPRSGAGQHEARLVRRVHDRPGGRRSS